MTPGERIGAALARLVERAGGGGATGTAVARTLAGLGFVPGGDAADPDGCPVANYLRAETGVPVWVNAVNAVALGGYAGGGVAGRKRVRWVVPLPAAVAGAVVSLGGGIHPWVDAAKLREQEA